MVLSILQFLISSQSNNTGRTIALSMEEIVLIQVRGERVLGENRLDRKRQSDQRNQPVHNVKKFRKGAKIGRIRQEELEENEKRHK